MLKISNLHVAVGDKKVLNGLDLQVPTGEVHAIMGPNGSGKSTLAHVLAGRPGYNVTEGSVTLDGRDLLALEPEERAHEGVFLGFQYPVEIPGVNNVYLLKAALNAARKHRGLPEVDAFDFLTLVRDKMKLMRMEASCHAESTRGSPAVKRSATRFCRCWSSSPSWPFSMRRTQDSISMR
jgi:Fe-S cluster assembly ATP-binding protein